MAYARPGDPVWWNWDYDMDDTWAYDGIRDAMVYNSAADQMLLYGGMLLWGGSGGSETWSFDTSTSMDVVRTGSDARQTILTRYGL
jgi:hypothetical protein